MFALVALAASAPAVTTQLALVGLTPESAVASSTTEEMLAPAGSTHWTLKGCPNPASAARYPRRP